jgi:hypothetical protein
VEDEKETQQGEDSHAANGAADYWCSKGKLVDYLMLQQKSLHGGMMA